MVRRLLAVIVAGVVLAALAPAALAWSSASYPTTGQRQMAVAPDGGILETWVASGTVYARYRDPDGAWSDDEIVATGQTTVTADPAVGAGGRAALAWWSGSSPSASPTVAIRDGGTWSVTPGLGSAGSSLGIDVAVSAGGDVTLAWLLSQSSPAGTFLRTRTFTDGSWLPEVVQSPSPSGTSPSMVADGDGVVLAWRTSGNDVVVAEGSAGSWEPAVTAGTGGRPTLAVGADGTVALAWPSNSECCSVPGSVFLTVRPPSGTWPDSAEVVDGPDLAIPSTTPQIAVGPDGQVGVTYGSDQSGGIVRARVRAADGTWDPTYTQLATGLYDTPRIVAEGDGAFTVLRAYRSGSRTAFATRRDPSGTWGADVQIADASPSSFVRLTVPVPLPGAGVRASFSWTGATRYAENLIVPSNSVLPEVTGLLRLGETLTASTGDWAGTRPIAHAVSWWRDTGDGGDWEQVGTGTTRVAAAEDVGHDLRIAVTASNAAGDGGAATSAPVSVLGLVPSATAPPAVAGTPQEGEVLTASPGEWTGTGPATFAYRWQRESGADAWEDVASGPEYLLGEADAGRSVRVVVEASNVWGAAAPVASAPVGPVTGRPRPEDPRPPDPPPATAEPAPAPPAPSSPAPAPAVPDAPRVDTLRPLCRAVDAGSPIRLSVTATDADTLAVVIRRQGSRAPARRMTRRVADGRTRLALPTAGLAPGTYRVTVGGRTTTVRIAPRGTAGGGCGTR